MMPRAGPCLAVVAACALAAAPASAQTCDEKCAEEMGDPDLHYFGSIGVYFSCSADPESPFPEDNECHTQWREGRCFVHAMCSEEDALLLAEAVGKSDAARLDRLLVQLGDRARYNTGLGTIDVKCGSIVVAQVAVPQVSADGQIGRVLATHLLRPYVRYLPRGIAHPVPVLTLRSMLRVGDP